ncbi:MAG TPA: VCBS repeat-containing protein, partial [Bryobacteraceae bacterium]|nr:VCBS repeat-containing protein [Bryobacteraceae bacterium]
MHVRNAYNFVRLGSLTLALWSVELAVAQTYPAFVRKDIHLTGHFDPAGPWSSGAHLGSRAGVVTGDFNRDGRPDLAISSLAGLSVLLNIGAGNFDVHYHPNSPSCGPGPLVTADFNRDGNPDLFMTCDFSGQILLGRGDGAFSAVLGGVPGCTSAAVGDFNNDGTPDLACNDPGDTSLRVQLGNGDGRFKSGISIQQGPSQPSQISVADFNHDGKHDLAARYGEFEAPSGHNVLLFLGKG